MSEEFMKKENLFIILGGVLVFLVGLILILNQLGFLSILSSGTAYGSYSVSPDGKTLTLSNFWKYEGFRTNHYLSTECALAGGCSMNNPGSPYYLFMLQVNGIDSSKFSVGGYKPAVCKFTPKDWQTYATNCYWDESDRVTYCGTGDYWGSDYQQIKDLGFTWYPGKTHCFVGGSISKLPTDKLTCSVKGTVNQLCEGNQIISTHCTPHNQPYDIQGIVRVGEGGYYCSIDRSKLYEQFPSGIMIPSRDTLQPIGIINVVSPQVIFKFAEQKTFYRLDNNLCTPIVLLENAKTTNDYDSLYECNQNVIELEKTYYRFEDNKCFPVTIMEDSKTINDYNTLSECERNIIIEPPQPILSPIAQFFVNIWDWIKGVFN